MSQQVLDQLRNQMRDAICLNCLRWEGKDSKKGRCSLLDLMCKPNDSCIAFVAANKNNNKTLSENLI